MIDVTTPVDGDLQRRFSLNLLRNEQVRTTLLVALFGALAMFLVVRLLFALSTSPISDVSYDKLVIPLGVVSALFVIEWMYRRFIILRVQARAPMPTVLWYLTTFLEFGALVAAFYFAQQFRVTPNLAGLPSQVALLFIFVMLSAFRLHFFITAFTGLLAAVCYLISVDIARNQQAAMSDTMIEEYFWVAGFIFGGSLIVGFVAMQVRRQTLGLARSLQDQQRLEGDVVRIAEEEQRRIGRDLHDGLGSHLTGVSMLCRGLARRLNKGQAIRENEMEEMALMVENAVAQARMLSRGLNPVKLDSGGLPSALHELAVNTQVVSGISCNFSLVGEVQHLTSQLGEHLYRIAQEAITNAVKHAHPEQITLSLDSQDNVLILTIKDDGKGFPDSTTTDGFGLQSMEYRARLIGATLAIEDGQDGGTVVQCVLHV